MVITLIHQNFCFIVTGTNILFPYNTETPMHIYELMSYEVMFIRRKELIQFSMINGPLISNGPFRDKEILLAP